MFRNLAWHAGVSAQVASKLRRRLPFSIFFVYIYYVYMRSTNSLGQGVEDAMIFSDLTTELLVEILSLLHYLQLVRCRRVRMSHHFTMPSLLVLQIAGRISS